MHQNEHLWSKGLTTYPPLIVPVLTLSKRQILDFRTERVCRRYNFKFDENGKKLSKWVENTVGKGEIARYQQFLLFPQCFQMT